MSFNDYIKAKADASRAMGQEKSKIQVIFTGGTIGSLAEGNNISPDGKAQFLLLDQYQKRTGNDTSRFKTTSPIYMLSENAVPNDTLKMVEEIRKAENSGVKGIIMTHGSDTLAHTSAYLGLLLPDLKVPVVLVASNLILTDKNANGIDNFSTAVDLIDNGVAPNVYVAYKNPEDDFTSIHLGTRMTEPPAYSDSFYSPTGKRFAIAKKNKIIFENTLVEKSDMHYQLDGKSFDTKCLYIPPFTGLNYEAYKGCDFDYVVHGLYHSGTANTREEYPNANLINFAKTCKAMGKPVYLCNIKKRDVNYDSTNRMKENGIDFLYDILPNVALAKANIAYNLIPAKDRERYLNSNINGEILQSAEKQINYEFERD